MKRIFFLASIALICQFSSCSYGQKEGSHNEELPVRVDNSDFVPLWNLEGQDLQVLLEKEIRSNPVWRELVNKKKMAVGLVDLRDLNNIEFAGLNSDVMMYAASLPKIAILLASMDAFEKGDLEEKPDYLDDLRLMIAKSDNAASTRMIDRLGYDRINGVLMDPRYQLYNKERGGGLWVGKRYAKTGTREPEPMKGISHAATAAQVCRYFYMLAYGQLVSFDRSKQMLDIMIDPELHHKFVNTIDKVAPNADVYRKSGTWKDYHADSMLVWGPTWRKYILVALIEDSRGEAICRQLVLSVEQVLAQRIPVPSE